MSYFALRNIVCVPDFALQNCDISRSEIRLSVTLRLDGQPIQIGVQKSLNLSIEYFVDIAHRMAGARVFDALVGMHKVISNLRPKPNSRFVLTVSSVLSFSLFLLDPGQCGAKHLPRLSSVLVLATLALALNHDPGGNMRQPNGAIGRIDMLTAGALGSIRVLSLIHI